MTPSERILAAVELNPDRSRVTLRRDDARQLIADNQCLVADVEHYKTGAIQLEAMCTEHCVTIDRLNGELEQWRRLGQRIAGMQEPPRRPEPQWALEGARPFALTQSRDESAMGWAFSAAVRLSAAVVGFGLSGLAGFALAHG